MELSGDSPSRSIFASRSAAQPGTEHSYATGGAEDGPIPYRISRPHPWYSKDAVRNAGFMVTEAPTPTRGAAFLLRWSPRRERRAPVYGPRNGKVVFRREGLRLHLPRRWGRGPLRAPFGHNGRGLQDPRRGRQGLLRGDP